MRGGAGRIREQPRLTRYSKTQAPPPCRSRCHLCPEATPVVALAVLVKAWPVQLDHRPHASAIEAALFGKVEQHRARVDVACKVLLEQLHHLCVPGTGQRATEKGDGEDLVAARAEWRAEYRQLAADGAVIEPRNADVTL